MMNKYEHGGNIYKNKVKYDFSANINPLGMPENVKNVLTANIDMFEKYPDINCTELKGAISSKYNLTPDNIVCGNGAIDIIYKAIDVINPGNCLLAVPCFSEYEKALLESGSGIQYYFRNKEKEYKVAVDYLEYMEDIDMLILCRPNNPTGDLIDKKLLDKILDKAARKKIFVILDECFIEFVKQDDEVTIRQADHILIINAFTKVYAMAGLRLGYAMSSNRELIKKISDYGPEWNVSAPAQMAGIEALKNTDYIVRTRQYIETERRYLIKELTKMNIKVFHSEANFILMYVDENIDEFQRENRLAGSGAFKNETETFFDYLLNRGIMIRDCSNFVGLGKGYYRIAVRTHNENEALIDAVKIFFDNPLLKNN